MTDYDVIEYPAKPFLQCHPDRLAIMGRLFGVAPHPPESSRVLEIGCGDGINLIAAAVTMPKARFTGLDLSGAAIGRGAKLVRELGLKNVRLKRCDFRSITHRVERFHYVVAHGLYSWVPPDVRDALLATIKAVLAPTGIAFVSYNAYPGAYLRQMVREMAGIFAGPDIPRAREWLQAARALTSGAPVYRAVLADEAGAMQGREDGALFHDDLATNNQPFWFRDFSTHAAAHNLQYLSEADLATTGSFGATGENRIMLEQHADFLTGRRFRQTLLCHADRTVLDQPDSRALSHCFTGGPLNPGTPQPDGTFEYRNPVGATLRTKNVEDRLILESVAAAWPCYLPVDEFGTNAHERLLHLFAANMLDLRTVPPPAADKISRPNASPLARLQSLSGPSVTTLHHMEVVMNSSSLRTVLSLADGTRTRTQLIREVQKLYPSEPKDKVTAAVNQHLEELRQYGLLLSQNQ
jgi:SAM-dependent methyltransferase